MGQKQALLLATFLTTFGLIVIGGVALRLTTPPVTVKGAMSQIAVKANSMSTAPDAVMQTPDPASIEALIQSREAAYQQALEQANRQLEAAYNQLDSVEQVQQAPATSGIAASAAPASAPAYAITAEIAQNIALAVVPGATLNKSAELVAFEGNTAYEVQTSGGVVYIEANTGKVLYNQATVPPVVVPGEQQSANFVPAPSVSFDDDDDHQEREEHEGDDDHEEEDD